jgi:hypothetical protein
MNIDSKVEISVIDYPFIKLSFIEKALACSLMDKEEIMMYHCKWELGGITYDDWHREDVLEEIVE